MFWTDWGEPEKIERANYDGSDRRNLVDIDLLLPNALALDVANNRLYWADAGTDRVESVNLDGGDRSSPPIFQAQSTRHFFGMVLLRNVLYITDWGQDSKIIRQPLGADQNNRTVYGSIGQRLNDIHAYDQDWASSGPNGCGNNNGGCSSFCIPLPGNNSKCLCPDGESLLSDNTTCANALVITTQATTTTTPQTTTATPPSTSEMTNIPVVVKTSHDLPFIADRSRDLTLTCDLTQIVTHYAWNMRCSSKGGNWCVFRPTAEDDGRKVTCTVTLADGRVAAGSLVLSLQYPPQLSPYITGYDSLSPLKVGDSLTMTCAVTGGKPLASAVIFSCPGHPDNARDIRSRTEVHSLMIISSLRKEDNGTRCECSGQWLGSSVFYPPRHSVTLLVLGGTPGGGASEKKTDLIPIIGGAVGGVVVVVLIIVIIVVIVKRRSLQRNHGARVQAEHTHHDLTFFNVMSDTEDHRSSLYAEINDTSILSHDPTTPAPPAPCSARYTPSLADDYLTPGQASSHPVHLGQSYPPPPLPNPYHSAGDDYAKVIKSH